MSGRHRSAQPPARDPLQGTSGPGGHRASRATSATRTTRASGTAGAPGAPSSRSRSLRPSRRLLAVVAVAVLAVAGLAFAFRPRAHQAAAQAGCSGVLKVPVIAAPSIARAVAAVAQRWNDTRPDVGGTCVSATVTAQDSAAAERALVLSEQATVWIPDSTVWTARLVADVPSLGARMKVGEPVATSPLVIAAPPGRADTMDAAANQGWAGYLDGTTPVAIPDPARNAEGALTLLGVARGLPASAAASTALAGAAVRLGSNIVASAADGFTNLRQHPGSAPAFVASEQEVLRANRDGSAPIAKAVYPDGAGPGLDFPLVTITPATDPSFVTAATNLAAQLQSPSARRAIAALGLRDPNGNPLDGTTDTGARSAAPPAPASSADLAGVMRIWGAARRPINLLAVIDVSGSMKDSAGNGRSKIDVAAGAAADALGLVPDTWSVGLWTFSSKRPPADDWTSLVPLGPVKTQRAALVTSARDLPNLVGGDTGLYATALAAFREVTAHYAPNMVDSVVLMTDGSNVDPGGISLPALLAALKQGFHPDKPVSITTIALGADADVAALRQISAATTGTTYVVRNPQDIRTVLLQTVLRRS